MPVSKDDRTRGGRSAVVATVLAALCGCSWLAPSEPPADRAEHVVIVSIDTLRADVLGTYGGRAKTPRIDAVAGDAVVFETHITAAPTTLASHTSLFTGTHPHTHGIPRNDYIVPEEHLMLPEAFAEAGFQTAAFLGAVPIGSHSEFTQGFEHIDEHFDRHRKQGEVEQTQRDAPAVTDAVLAWLDAGRDADRPMFLFVHYFDVHAPYVAPPKYRALYDLDKARAYQGTMGHLKKVRAWLARGLPKGKTEAAVLKELYLSGVSWVDFELGRMLDGLDAAGLLDDTLLIITSDHGETFDSHEETFDHGYSVYDETVRTPLILRFPKGEHAGERVSRAVSNVDIVPTLLEVFGLSWSSDIEGRSLIPVIEGDPDKGGPRPVFSEATKSKVQASEGWTNGPMDKAVRTDSAKLIVRPALDDAQEVYDLSADPGEVTNLAGRDDAREAELRSELDAWRAEANPAATHRDSSARRKAELQALGYLGGE